MNVVKEIWSRELINATDSQLSEPCTIGNLRCVDHRLTANRNHRCNVIQLHDRQRATAAVAKCQAGIRKGLKAMKRGASAPGTVGVHFWSDFWETRVRENLVVKGYYVVLNWRLSIIIINNNIEMYIAELSIAMVDIKYISWSPLLYSSIRPKSKEVLRLSSAVDLSCSSGIYFALPRRLVSSRPLQAE